MTRILPLLAFALLGCAAPNVPTVGIVPDPADARWTWQNTGYSRSYGTWSDWQRYLNSRNAVLKPVPAWPHYDANTRYTLQPGLESLDHYLTRQPTDP